MRRVQILNWICLKGIEKMILEKLDEMGPDIELDLTEAN